MMLSDHILLRFLDKTASPQEVELVENWIEASTENRKHFQEWLTVYYESTHVKDYKLADVDLEWNSFKAERNDIHKPIENVFSLRRIIQYSAVACLALIAAFIFLNPSNDIIKHSAGSEGISINLPDNSEVNLMANSSIEYSKDFGNASKRRVKLNGDAKFDVVSDKNKPFVVESDLVSIKVLGTIFIIEQGDKGAAKISVIEGKVAVSSTVNKNQNVILKKGETVDYNGDQFGEVNSTEELKTQDIKNEPSTRDNPAQVEDNSIKTEAIEEYPADENSSKDLAPVNTAEDVESSSKSEVKLSKYSVNDVLEFLDERHVDNAKFSRSRKAKAGKSEVVLLNLEQPMEDILKRLEAQYHLEYDSGKCEGCIDLKKITKK